MCSFLRREVQKSHGRSVGWKTLWKRENFQENISATYKIYNIPCYNTCQSVICFTYSPEKNFMVWQFRKDSFVSKICFRENWVTSSILYKIKQNSGPFVLMKLISNVFENFNRCFCWNIVTTWPYWNGIFCIIMPLVSQICIQVEPYE